MYFVEVYTYIDKYMYIYVYMCIYISVWQCLAVSCSVLQLQFRHTKQFSSDRSLPHPAILFILQHTATHCNTLQHTATYCISSDRSLPNVLQPFNLHYNTLQHTTAHYSTLQHTATQPFCGGELFFWHVCRAHTSRDTRPPNWIHYMGYQQTFESAQLPSQLPVELFMSCLLRIGTCVWRHTLGQFACTLAHCLLNRIACVCVRQHAATHWSAQCTALPVQDTVRHCKTLWDTTTHRNTMHIAFGEPLRMWKWLFARGLK